MTIGKISVACAALLMVLLLAIRPTRAESRQKRNGVEQELVRTETGFFEAWKSKDQAYFRNHIPENGVFWGEYGTFSRTQQLEEQQASLKNCTVDGYSLSDFGVLSLASGVYLLTYKVEQYATCGGEKVPVHMNGSSVYIFKDGRWQAIYRAEVPMKNRCCPSFNPRKGEIGMKNASCDIRVYCIGKLWKSSGTQSLVGR